MNHVTEGLANFIWEHKDTVGPSGLSINRVLGEIRQELVASHDWEPEILQEPDCPCICLGLPVMGPKTWVAAPWTIQTRWEIEIICYLVFDDDRNNARAIKRFFKAVERLFEDQKHERIRITPDEEEKVYAPEGYYLHYNGEPPIVGGSINYEEVGEGLFLRRATLNWVGYEIRQVAQGYS